MSSESDQKFSWDLEQYSTKARQDKRREAIDARRAEGLGVEEEHLTEVDDGDWLAPAETKTRARYVEAGSVFWSAFAGGLLTILTLGFYRFWLKTNLRRVYVGSIRVDGDPIEYTGTGLEKFIGFLIAISFLAIYLAITNVGLLFIGITQLEEGALFTPFSLIAVMPFIFYAQYRSQRYMLSRLRWRGIRFGLGGSAWGFTGRSLLWGILTVLSAGILFPLMHFRQARYLTNRTYFGSLKCEQGGSWLGLLSLWIWVYISFGLLFLFGWGMVEEMRLQEEGVAVLISVLMPFAFLLTLIMFFNYQVGAFRYLWDNRSIGITRIENDVSTGKLIMTYIKGYLVVAIVGSLIGIIGAVVLLGAGFLLTSTMLGELGLTMDDLEAQFTAMASGQSDPSPALIAAVLPLVVGALGAYLFLFVVSYAFTQSMIIQPILRQKVEAMLIRRPEALQKAGQRQGDQAAEAGGFADALGVDMGAGFG